MKKILLNGGWLVVVPMVFNLAFFRQLPRAFSAEVFWIDIPAIISYPENILRTAIFAAPFAMRIELGRVRGLALYGIGMIVYMACWLVAMFQKDGAFLHSGIGFTSLAYTSELWLAGIGFSTASYFGPEVQVRRLYVASTLAFVVFHTWHTYHVFSRLA
jgi:hypothetical protein